MDMNDYEDFKMYKDNYTHVYLRNYSYVLKEFI